jgi:uncharacterized protein
MDKIKYISSSFEKIADSQIIKTLKLLDEGATIPFISRYRKEMTGGLDEVEILDISTLSQKFDELQTRKVSILKSINEQDKLSPELEAQIEACLDITELEDLYLPFKKKRKTKADIARENGLEPLAKIIMAQNNPNMLYKAESFVDGDMVKSIEDALEGARNIISEWINEHIGLRKNLRRIFKNTAFIESKVVKSKIEDAQLYKSYFDWRMKADRAQSHNVLAIFRAESEGFLRVKIDVDKEYALDTIKRIFIKKGAADYSQVELAINDAYTRLLKPSLETELKTELKEKADDAAINIFKENLRQLLLSPPLGSKKILAIDPGFRTGCKVVCLDKNGKLLHNETIYPHPPQREMTMAKKKISSLVNTYSIEFIAIGNGTAARETESFIRSVRFDRDLKALMVNEDGASVYSASKVAREEFPEYDVTVRGAVSIGRRLMDPLAEYVKIDPKSLGIGQYQHDVDQKKLAESLQQTVDSCVNFVGVNLNTASKELLSYVSGIGDTIAKNIIQYRNENGEFKERRELKNVSRLGEHAFQQCAGFLRIKNESNPLENTAVHPESYHVVENISTISGKSITELAGNNAVLNKLNPKDFVDEKTGLPTIKDIIEELKKPGRDPRQDFKIFEFDRNIRSIDDLKVGMIIPGIVNNITAFGAFIDLGIKENGLLHKSEIASEFVEDPSKYLKLNDKLELKIVEIDLKRKRIGLSLKQI